MANTSLRVRGLTAVGITALVVCSGVAVAFAASGGDTGAGEQAEAATSTTSTTSTTTTTAPLRSDPAALVESDDESTERFWGAECGTGEPTNHGQYVSSAPKDGESRREAAHSDCGKPLASVKSESISEHDDDAESDANEATPPSRESPGKSGSAPGHEKRG